MPGEVDKDRFLSIGKVYIDDFEMGNELKKPPELSTIQNDLKDF